MVILKQKSGERGLNQGHFCDFIRFRQIFLFGTLLILLLESQFLPELLSSSKLKLKLSVEAASHSTHIKQRKVSIHQRRVKEKKRVENQRSKYGGIQPGGKSTVEEKRMSEEKEQVIDSTGDIMDKGKGTPKTTAYC